MILVIIFVSLDKKDHSLNKMYVEVRLYDSNFPLSFFLPFIFT